MYHDVDGAWTRRGDTDTSYERIRIQARTVESVCIVIVYLMSVNDDVVMYCGVWMMSDTVMTVDWSWSWTLSLMSHDS